MSDSDQPKIIVDDDWKSQAKAEKQKLAAEDAKSKAEKGPEGEKLPDKLGFEDLIKMLATQALMYMGAFPDPQTGQAMIALDVAKLNVDLLGVLQEKTKGNLSEDEKSMLDGISNDLRLQFAEVVKALQRAQAEGKLQDSGGGVSGIPGTGTPGAPPQA